MRFLHADPIQVGSISIRASEVIKLMDPYLSESRRARIAAIVADRTYSVATVLEDIYDRGNASAVMRSAEAMGFQAVHMIEKGEKFKASNRVTKGADKWLDVTRWKSTTECVLKLREQGYQILATHLDASSQSIDSLDFSKPTALVLGNEKDGVSQELLNLSDHRVVIPMHGFVQSFNILVAGAIALYHIRQARLQSLARNGDLNEREIEILRAVFYLRSSKNPERLLQRLMKSY